MIKFAIKFVVSAGLLVFIFLHIGIPSVLNVIYKSNIFYIVLALIFQLLSTTFASKRWYLLMNILNFKENFLFYLKSYFKAMFFNQILPGSISGDVIKIVDLSQAGYNKKASFFGVLIDRLIGLFALFLINLIALLSSHILPANIHDLILIVSSVGLLGFFFFAFIYKIKILKNLRIVSILQEISLYLKGIIKNRMFIILIVISIFVHACTFFDLFFLFKAMGLNVHILTFAIIIPPVILLTIIPISLAGWGIRESAMVTLFSFLGIHKDLILAVSIMYGFVLIISSLPGVFTFLISKRII